MDKGWILRVRGVTLTRRVPLYPFDTSTCGHPVSHHYLTSIIQKISSLIVRNLHANYPYPEKCGGRLEKYREMSEITEM
jgi:hypothetical protein